MKIAVIGTGYVGLVTGVCLAHTGHQVACVDVNEEKVRRMQAGSIPIYEPGLEDLFRQVLNSRQLTITTSLEEGIAGAEVIFLALPTPPGADGAADLSAVLTVADNLGPLLQQYTVIVDKSTVPVGTAERVENRIRVNASVNFAVVSNPEFLREGLAVNDFMRPDRIVIGTSSDKAGDIMRNVYKSFITRDEQLVFMDVRSAEMTKYAANSFLAMKVSFMNEIANLCEMLGANVDSVRLGIGPDQRIGSKFLNAGIGYGGSCFPKDVQALQHTAQSVGYDFKLLGSIIQVNTSQKQRLFEKVQRYYQNDLKDKHFAIWGLAFKPDTDDIREAPSLELIQKLLDAGATIAAYDPEAIDNVRKYFSNHENLQFAETPEDALKNADALLIVTEWQAFRNLKFETMHTLLKAPVVFDGRNLYKSEDATHHNVHYESIGRPTAK